MKTRLLLSIALFLFVFNSSYSQCESVPAGSTCVPDDNFEYFLETRAANGAFVGIGHPDSLGDGDETNNLVPTSKISGLTEINLFNQSIADLTGIEDFASLTKLECRGNILSSIDVSMLALEHLDLDTNNFSSISVSSNPELTFLDVGNNNLSTIVLDSNTNLTVLDVSNNDLNDLDVSSNTMLTNLGCSGNNLTSLILTDNDLLTRLTCADNDFTMLNLSSNTLLETIWCYQNFSLTDITLPETDTVTSFYCYRTALTTIDVTDFTNLETLWCYESDLTGTLDISSNIKLENFDCGDNNISNIITPNDLDTLWRFWCDNNNLTSLIVSNNLVLENLKCDNNPNLLSLDLTSNELLEQLRCYNNTSMSSMMLPTTNTLTYIDAFSTGLTSLDASGLTGLNYLRMNDSSSLTSLILPNTPTLQTFWMYGHDLPSIDFTPYTNLHTGLQYLDLSNSNLASVDVSMLEGLLEFYCYDSAMLNYLNIANGNNGSLGWMWANNNPSLNCIQVDDVAQAQAKPNWDEDAPSYYSTSCPPPLSTEEFLEKSISLFPNPAKNKVFLDTATNVSYHLVNIQGQEMFKGRFNIGMNEVDLSSLPYGLYFLNLESNEGSLVKKIVKN